MKVNQKVNQNIYPKTYPKTYSTSIQGHRKQNEDQHEVIPGKINFYAVYDGHGGKEVSKYLKKNLSQYFVDRRVNYPLKKKYVNNVYDHIQNSLKKHGYSYHSGSTALVVIKFKDKLSTVLNIMNTGDGRCVLCRDNFALSLTKDHKPHWPEEHKRIADLGGKIKFDGHDWRIKDLSVSRAFGDLDSAPYVTHRPDLFRYTLGEKDKFIIIACDGLWDVLQDHDAVNFVLDKSYDKNGNRIDVNITKLLTDYALKEGSTDNITVVVVFIK